MTPTGLPDDDLMPDEARALAALREPVEPPAGLRDRVEANLRRRGAIRSSARRWVGPLAAAAGIVLAYYAGTRSAASTPPAVSGTQYAFFLMNTPETQWPDSMTESQVVEAFRQWAGPLATAGRLAVADELAPQHYLVDADNVRDGDVATGMNGFFVVTAISDSAAFALARSLPSVRHGGVVAVQRLMSR